eukprot:snap_masked-scaffold_4-processed-gene-5.27-mRNA-1 protein AED:1.00 eAED:1.00 QI:0/-1/0/0/-1/1/1/0/103
MYVANRAMEGLREILSYERIFKRKPKIHKFYIFGALIVYVNKTENKIQFKGTYGYFMEYNPVTGEALNVDKMTRKLVKTRDFKASITMENIFKIKDDSEQKKM